MISGKIGVVLLNMGGPGKLEDVRPFLFNLFSDREIIRLGPPFLQKPLAWYIARKRAPGSMATYARIGGGSPLAEITRAQQEALERRLHDRGTFKVVTAMRYWQPTTEAAVRTLVDFGVDTIIALSLYPHFSRATSGSSLRELNRVLAGQVGNYRCLEIPSWPDHPTYIASLAGKIREGLESFGGDTVEVVYSAHSLPVSFIEEGDPYLDHLNRTIAAVEKLTAHPGRLCFQSRSGPVEWLSPSTPETLEELSRSGCRNVLMVPLSFVSDHVETLYEINIQYRELAADLGMHLEPSGSLNTDPLFIRALEELVIQGLAGSQEPAHSAP